MGLASVMQTALSGMSAARLALGATANNLANSQTAGFKSSRPTFATQPSQTQSLGAAPSESNGGTSPVQIGLGVQPGGTSVNFAQGSTALNSDPLSLALQGDGMFILEGDGGQRVFSRNGQFSLNADSELVSSGGRRVLGFGVDENSQLQTNGLTPLKIRLGQQVPADDGSAATLTSFSIHTDGRIVGMFSDGMSRDLGQIQVARFPNPSGLQQQGGSVFAAGPNSGLAVQASPGAAGAATIISGATELSNTDIGEELVNLIQAETQFRAGALTIGTANEMLDNLMGLLRPS